MYSKNGGIVGYAYSRTFLENKGLLCEDDWLEVLFYAKSIGIIKDHGCCRFFAENKENAVDAVTRNMKHYTDKYEKMISAPTLLGEFGDLIAAYFIFHYYIRSIELARMSGDKNSISLSIFNIMQFVCLKVAPKWIENEYLFALSELERSWLQLLHKSYETDDELWIDISKDSLISVIITTYNRGEVLPRALDNILRQTWKNLELIVVDDGSEDNTRDAVKRFEDKRIRYISVEQNRGVSHARNVGIDAASGTYIVYQDDDDLSRLDKLEKQMIFMERCPKHVGFCYHETINHIRKVEGYEDGSAVILPSREMADVKKTGLIFPAILPWNFVACTSMMIRKSCFEKTGTFDESLFAFEDWDMTLRLARDFEVRFIKEPLYDYFQSEDGLLFSADTEHREKVVRAINYIDRKFENDRKSYGIESISR